MSATQRWSALAVGLAFGFFLTASGLGNYRTIHDGLLLRDPYIYLMMASTVAMALTVMPGQVAPTPNPTPNTAPP